MFCYHNRKLFQRHFAQVFPKSELAPERFTEPISKFHHNERIPPCSTIDRTKTTSFGANHVSAATQSPGAIVPLWLRHGASHQDSGESSYSTLLRRTTLLPQIRSARTSRSLPSKIDYPPTCRTVLASRRFSNRDSLSPRSEWTNSDQTGKQRCCNIAYFLMI
jgi:hypothetical protein